jgi:hypothetical protein
MNIEIVDYSPYHPRDGKASYLKGYLRLKLKTEWGWLHCNDMTVYSKNGKHWVSLPNKKVEEPEGVKYYNYCRFEREDSDKFSEIVIQALKAWNLAKRSPNTDQPPLTQPASSNGPKKAIPETIQSMDPVFRSVSTNEELPF